jgi:heme exporter protein C
MMQKFFQPKFLLSQSATLLSWSFGGTILFGCIGLFLSLIFSPSDYQQGETVRIMYVHVPASWGALSVYTIMAILSAWGFVARAPMLHLITKSIAPIGLAYTIISLGTGSIWGKPTWGTWWVWDARLTSMLLLLFLYLGYWTIVTTIEDEEKGIQAGALIAIIGWINIPIIKWSVDWWHTLHQPASVLRFAKPAIHWSMLMPLITMALFFASFGIALSILRIRTALNIKKLKTMQMRSTPEHTFKEVA